MRIFPLVATAGLAFMAMPGIASAAVAAPQAPLAAPVAVTLAQASVRISVGDQDRRHYRRHHGRKAYYRRSCRTKWRHGHRYRDCRRVRYWR